MKLWFWMLRMCVYMHSRFIENHSIRILEDGPLISEVVLSHSRCGRLGRCHRGSHWDCLTDVVSTPVALSLSLYLTTKGTTENGGRADKLMLGLCRVKGFVPRSGDGCHWSAMDSWDCIGAGLAGLWATGPCGGGMRLGGSGLDAAC
jgi:hypothetical protein